MIKEYLWYLIKDWWVASWMEVIFFCIIIVSGIVCYNLWGFWGAVGAPLFCIFWIALWGGDAY